MFKHDTHLHFDLYKNRQGIIDYVELNKSYTIGVTNLPDIYERYIGLDKDRKYFKIALGFHPELVPDYHNQIQKFKKYAKDARYIGEIGLDYTVQDLNKQQIQRSTFDKITTACNDYGEKILTVHSRRAEKDVLSVLCGLNNCKVILHWYSGSLSNMDVALNRGYYFSINYQMIQSQNGRRIVNNIPNERLLIESDGPFNKGIEDTYNLKFQNDIYYYLMEKRGLASKELSEMLRNNFMCLLK